MTDYTIKIEQDDAPESPREWDNLGVMCLDHKRHIVPWEYEGVDKDHPVYYENGSLWQPRQCKSWSDVKQALRQAVNREGDEIVVILPVYAYDHSVFDISTQIEPYWWHAAWDSGQLGFIFITRSKVLAEYGWKKITPERRAKLADRLATEVKTYSQWVNGDVYGYIITDEDDEPVDSCWGYFGHEAAEKAAKEAVAALSKGE